MDPGHKIPSFFPKAFGSLQRACIFNERVYFPALLSPLGADCLDANATWHLHPCLNNPSYPESGEQRGRLKAATSLQRTIWTLLLYFSLMFNSLFEFIWRTRWQHLNPFNTNCVLLCRHVVHHSASCKMYFAAWSLVRGGDADKSEKHIMKWIRCDFIKYLQDVWQSVPKTNKKFQISDYTEPANYDSSNPTGFSYKI